MYMFYIWQFLQSVRKEIKAPIALVQDKKKNEDNKSKFYISQMAVANLIKFACGLPYLVDSYNTKIVCFGEGARTYMYE